MTESEWLKLKGTVMKGHRVASGPSKEYPEYGSIEKQKPYFKKLGLDLSRMYNGTLNISIHPYEFEMTNPEYKFKKVQWTELANAEDFSFSRCRINFQGREYNGWVYYPDPSTKEAHFQPPTIIEVLAPQIPNIRYKNRVEVSLRTEEIKIFPDPESNDAPKKM